MEFTKEQKEILYKSLVEKCTKCVKETNGICRGQLCEVFSLKNELDDELHFEEKRYNEWLKKTNQELNTVRTKLNKYAEELSELKAQRNLVSNNIHKVSSLISNNKNRYASLSSLLDKAKQTNKIPFVAVAERKRKSHNTPYIKVDLTNEQSIQEGLNKYVNKISCIFAEIHGIDDKEKEYYRIRLLNSQRYNAEAKIKILKSALQKLQDK